MTNTPPPTPDPERPMLSNGDEAAAGDLVHALRPFCPGPWSGRPVGFATVQRSLIQGKKQPVSLSETDERIDEMKSAGYLDEVPHPGPSIQFAVGRDLPGVPRLKDIYSVGDPQPGERCFLATPLGRKAAFLAATLGAGSNAPWILGGARIIDQVILCCRPLLAVRFDEIDGSCPCTATEHVREAVNAAVRRGLLMEQDTDRFTLTLDGEGRHHALGAELLELQSARRVSPPLTPSHSSPTDALVTSLGFLADSARRTIVERDLRELDRVMSVQSHKAALLLCGSILEGVLVDVLDRNPGIAQSFMKGNQRWPDDASLEKLIEIASKTILACTPPRTLLTPSASAFAGSLTDHRDLVHPQAEIRQGIHVDQTTAEAMFMLLKVVVRDLAEAEKEDLLDLYANGKTV